MMQGKPPEIYEGHLSLDSKQWEIWSLNQLPLVTRQETQWSYRDTNLLTKLLTQTLSHLQEMQARGQWRGDGVNG